MLEDGSLFIDRNGRYFEPILDYLRSGRVHIPADMSEERVAEEANFFLVSPSSPRLGCSRLPRRIYIVPIMPRNR